MTPEEEKRLYDQAWDMRGIFEKSKRLPMGHGLTLTPYETRQLGAFLRDIFVNEVLSK